MVADEYPVVVLMGVSGSGKSRIGRRLADQLHVSFLEGDALHTTTSVDKMAHGMALDDRDRASWLVAIHRWIAARHGEGGVVACSALRRAYRRVLADGIAPSPRFVVLSPSRATLEARLRARTGHFMPASLLDSQLSTFEPPTPDEHALTLSNEGDEQQSVLAVMRWLTDRKVRSTTYASPPM